MKDQIDKALDLDIDPSGTFNSLKPPKLRIEGNNLIITTDDERTQKYKIVIDWGDSDEDFAAVIAAFPNTVVDITSHPYGTFVVEAQAEGCDSASSSIKVMNKRIRINATQYVPDPTETSGIIRANKHWNINTIQFSMRTVGGPIVNLYPSMVIRNASDGTFVGIGSVSGVDENGCFSTSDSYLPAGNYTVSLYRIGHFPYEHSAVITLSEENYDVVINGVEIFAGDAPVYNIYDYNPNETNTKYTTFEDGCEMGDGVIDSDDIEAATLGTDINNKLERLIFDYDADYRVKTDVEIAWLNYILGVSVADLYPTSP